MNLHLDGDRLWLRSDHDTAFILKRDILWWQARNRRLASDLQSLQQQLKAKDDAIGQMQDRLAGLEQEVRHKAALVQSLERDLLHASQNAASPAEGSEPATAELAGTDGAEVSRQASSRGASSSSLLSIITSQRDRFRGRCLTRFPEYRLFLVDRLSNCCCGSYQALCMPAPVLKNMITMLIAYVDAGSQFLEFRKILCFEVEVLALYG